MISKVLLSVLIIIAFLGSSQADDADLQSLFPQQFLQNKEVPVTNKVSIEPTKAASIPSSIPDNKIIEQPKTAVKSTNELTKEQKLLNLTSSTNSNLESSKVSTLPGLPPLILDTEPTKEQKLPEQPSIINNQTKTVVSETSVLPTLPPLILDIEDDKDSSTINTTSSKDIPLAEEPIVQQTISKSEPADDHSIMENLPLLPEPITETKDIKDAKVPEKLEEKSKVETIENQNLLSNQELESKLKKLNTLNHTEIKINNPTGTKKSTVDDTQFELQPQKKFNKKSPNFEGLVTPKELLNEKSEQPEEYNDKAIRNISKPIDSNSASYQMNPYDIWKDSVMFTQEEAEQLQNAFNSYLLGTVSSTMKKDEEKTDQKPDEATQKIVKKPLVLNLRSILYLNKNLWSVWINNKRYTADNEQKDDNLGFEIINVFQDHVELLVKINSNYLIPEDLYKHTGYNQVAFHMENSSATVILYTNQTFSSEIMNVEEGNTLPIVEKPSKTKDQSDAVTKPENIAK